MGGRFGFRTRKVDEVELVEIVGDLDLHTLSLIDNLLQKLISRGVRNIVLDLRNKLDATGYYDTPEVERVVAVELNPNAKQSQLEAAITPVADRLIIPFVPRSFDVWTIAHVTQLLEEMLPEETYYAYHLNVIRHVRQVCGARRPQCPGCVLRAVCDYGRAEQSTP